MSQDDLAKKIEEVKQLVAKKLGQSLSDDDVKIINAVMALIQSSKAGGAIVEKERIRETVVVKLGKGEAKA